MRSLSSISAMLQLFYLMELSEGQVRGRISSQGQGVPAPSLSLLGSMHERNIYKPKSSNSSIRQGIREFAEHSSTHSRPTNFPVHNMAAAARTSNILIFGATGLIGTHITSAILNAAPQQAWSVAIFTSPETAQNKSHVISDLTSRGANIITGDFTNADDVNAAYEGIDTVVSCLGRPVIDKQVLLVQLADAHPSVRRFFPSEYGTDIEYGPKSKGEPTHQMKIAVRAAIREAKDLGHTFVVTGPYGDADGGLYLSAGGGEKGSFDVANRQAVVIGDGEGKISLTTMRDVGKLTVAALTHPKEARNRALKVNSFTTTPNELVREFERQTGSQKWSVSSTSLDQLREMEKAAWEEGNPAAGGLTLRRIWAEGGTLYETRNNALIGMEEGGQLDDLQSCVRQAIEVQLQQGSGAKM